MLESNAERSAVETALTGLGAVQLLALLRTGEVSAAEVVDAHLQRMNEVQPELNAVVYRRDEEARHEAVAIDAKRLRGEPLGLLAGLPMTLKDCFQLAGSSATMGLRRLAHRPDVTDGPLAARAKAAGAIIVGKTNVPQLMLMHETDSPLFGRANHPLDNNRDPGGSSGGEAAILAAKGSALGLGSDLGGSIRQPAHACGIAGLMPTPGRLTVVGCQLNYPRLQAIHLQPGPLARRVEDLALAMQALVPPIQTSSGENALRGSKVGIQADEAPVAWRDPCERDLTRLRVAMFVDDGNFTPSPAIRRAIKESGGKLRRAGIEVEDFTPPGMGELMELYVGLLSADGMEGLRRLLANDAADWRLKRLLYLGSLPNWMRPLVSSVYHWRGQRRLARLVTMAGPRSADGYLQLAERLDAFGSRFFQSLAEGGFSAMLFPPHGLPALTHGSSTNLLSAASYCFLPNLLGVPAGVVPVTTVGAEEESDRPADADITEQTALKVERGSAGLPIGVQVAALPWREDIVLGLMRLLES
jgi:fatty acid amide hydrolase